MDKEKIKENFMQPNTWTRGLIMLVFLIVSYIVKTVVLFIVVFQFICTLVTGSQNKRLITAGNALTKYVTEILLFLTYNTEERPFPFSEFPNADEQEVVETGDDV